MKTLRGRHVTISAILLCALFLGYRIYAENLDATLVNEQTLEDAVPTVSVVYPKPGLPTETITLAGNIVGWYEAPMYAQVTGYVKRWFKDYGAQVKRGEVLAEINAPDLDTEFAQARADLDTERAKYRLAEVTAKRWVALRQNHAGSEQSIAVREQNLKVQAAVVRAAEQKVKNIEAFIRFKTIVAPFDGVVTQRNINVGDLVSTEGALGTTNAIPNLFTVADVHMLRLFVSVPESFGPFLQPGLTAVVTVPQLPNRHFTAKFLAVARGFDASTRTAVTVFTIENEDRTLWPGSNARVQLTAPVDRQVTTIPSTALVFQEHGSQVAVVTENDRVHLKSIIVSKLLDNVIEVAEGISASDRIVNNPSAALRDDAKVRVVTPERGYDLVTADAPAAQEDPAPQEYGSR